MSLRSKFLTFSASAVLALAPILALAQVRVDMLTATDLGVSAVALSGNPATAAIAMDSASKGSFNTIVFNVTGTPGTTTAVVVECTESEASDGTFVKKNVCDSSASATCAKDSRSYTFTVAAGSGFTSQWKTAARWMKCSFTGSGTGSISVTAQRSRQ